MRPSGNTLGWTWLSLMLLFCALPRTARAETLVLRDGTQLEVRGEVEQRSGRVLYTDAGGTLRSIRASEVDWDATRRAEAAQADVSADSAVAAVAAPVVLTLDNNSVSAHQAAPVTREADQSPDTSGLVVEQWERATTDRGEVVRGQLRNTLERTVLRVEVELQLLGFDGEPVGRARASVPSIDSGDLAPFEAALPEGPAFREVRFGFDRMVLRTPVSSAESPDPQEASSAAPSPDGDRSQTGAGPAVSPPV